MNDVASKMIKLAMENTNNSDIAKGLQIALELIAESAYMSMSDWEEMSENERLEHIEEHINETDRKFL